MARCLLIWMVFLADLLLQSHMAASRPLLPAVEGAALEISGAGEANAPALSMRLYGPEFGKVAGPPADAAGEGEHHRKADKSVAGAEVMLGGMATAFLAAIVAYVRVTRKRSSDAKVRFFK